jgi:hypothetical protein
VKLAAVWEFIAGDSRFAPAAVALAVIVAVVLLRMQVAAGVVAAAFACMIALGLAAAVFERR